MKHKVGFLCILTSYLMWLVSSNFSKERAFLIFRVKKDLVF